MAYYKLCVVDRSPAEIVKNATKEEQSNLLISTSTRHSKSKEAAENYSLDLVRTKIQPPY